MWCANAMVRALRGAVGDDKIRAVAIDMADFSGGGLVHLEEIGAAMDAVRAAKSRCWSMA
jgi:protease-4